MGYPTGSVMWENVPVSDKGVSQLHCVPVNDIDGHRLCEHCDCQPVEDNDKPDYWVHNAFDRREAHYERGAKMH